MLFVLYLFFYSLYLTYIHFHSKESHVCNSIFHVIPIELIRKLFTFNIFILKYQKYDMAVDDLLQTVDSSLIFLNLKG